MESVFKIIKTILGIVSDICLLVIILYGVFFIPLIVGYHPMVMTDGSDKEVIYKEGALLYYKKVGYNEVKLNDVIVYKPGSEYVVHKVNKVVHTDDVNTNTTEEDIDRAVNGQELSEDNTYYETSPDAYRKEDPNRIAYKDVVGKVADIYVPYIGKYIMFMNHHLSILYVAIGIVLFDLVFGSFIKKEGK